MRVLIADDSAEVRRRLAELLAGLDGITRVEVARDGEEALKLFEQAHPDAIVLDFRMPRRNGLEVLRIVKQRRPATVVVVFTNFAQSPYRTRCLAAGADYFFDKSEEFEKVGEVIARQIQERQDDTRR